MALADRSRNRDNIPAIATLIPVIAKCYLYKRAEFTDVGVYLGWKVHGVAIVYFTI